MFDVKDMNRVSKRMEGQEFKTMKQKEAFVMDIFDNGILANRKRAEEESLAAAWLLK